jgi:hypothetical protein
MKKVILVFAIGAAAGYSFGFKDARRHRDNIVVRTVARVGGSHRENMKTDVDREMQRLER